MEQLQTETTRIWCKIFTGFIWWSNAPCIRRHRTGKNQRDDIILGGKSIEDHNRILQEVTTKCSKTQHNLQQGEMCIWKKRNRILWASFHREWVETWSIQDQGNNGVWKTPVKRRSKKFPCDDRILGQPYLRPCHSDGTTEEIDKEEHEIQMGKRWRSSIWET